MEICIFDSQKRDVIFSTKGFTGMIEILRGCDLRYKVQLRNELGNIDITGKTISFEIKGEDLVLIKTLSVGDGVSVDSATDGTFSILFNPTNYATLTQVYYKCVLKVDNELVKTYYLKFRSGV